MPRKEQEIERYISKLERNAEKELRELQSTQSFSGTLRIKLDRVFVDKVDGKRALDQLRHLASERVIKVK